MDVMERAAGPGLAHDDDQVMVLRDVSWAQYEALLRARGENPSPLMAYLDGELELVTTSRHHEQIKKLLARLLEAYAEETGLELNGFGHATLRKKARRAGCEPDEWYCVGVEKPAPDLAIEVVYTSGGVDKLEVYRRLGAHEVWFWIDERIRIYVLVEGEYRERTRSAVISGFDFTTVTRIVRSTGPTKQTKAVRDFRRGLQKLRS